MMKTFCLSCLAVLMLQLCNAQQAEAKKKAEEIKKTVAATSPGAYATMENSWTMTATIDGKKWKAKEMMPASVTGRILGSLSDAEYISLPYDGKSAQVGKKIQLSEDRAADLGTKDDTGIWGGRSGEIEITKVNGDWVEGKFHFTASSYSTKKTFEVSDGFFRISISAR